MPKYAIYAIDVGNKLEADEEGHLFARVEVEEITLEELMEREHLATRRAGHWGTTDTAPDECGNLWYVCSSCGKGDRHAPEIKVPFCWNCGAHMLDLTDRLNPNRREDTRRGGGTEQ